MKQASLNCLIEAYRRWVCIGSEMNALKPLGQKWLGLGSASSYKTVIADGYMAWVHGIPSPRTSGWLRLTLKGEEVMRKFAAKGIAESDFQNFDFTGRSKLGNINSL